MLSCFVLAEVFLVKPIISAQCNSPEGAMTCKHYNSTNLNLMQPVPVEGAIHINSTHFFLALLVWVAADYKNHTKTLNVQ